MQGHGGLEDLQGLHQDLIAFSQGQLRNIERLWIQLDGHVGEFKHLLEKPGKNESSRSKLLSGTITIDDEEYTVNKEFQDNAVHLADTLDLDETQSASLLLEAQEEAELLDRPLATTAILNFQQRRQFLLECLRLTLSFSIESGVEENIRRLGRDVVGMVLGTREGSLRDGPAFVQKCLQGMYDIEHWLQDLFQRIQGEVALGQIVSPESDETSILQQQSLTRQHESLCGVITLLTKASYSTTENFCNVLDHLAKLDRWSRLAVHYAPIILALIFQHGSSEGSGSLRDARAIHEKLTDSRDISSWVLRQFKAAVQAWWLAEYSGWYQEQQGGSPLRGVNLELEAMARSESFFQALKEGAFECTLTMCSQIKSHQKYDPARSSLVAFLLGDAPSFQQDNLQTSDWFEITLQEQLEMFVDALIANMPDTLRHFKSEEDDQRKRIYSNLQKANPSASNRQDFYLERFLVIISFSFDQRTEAAQAFWDDQDSNLYGFLQWASKRQSTPCVSAFCEMLQSISNCEEYATSAHQFLLDEGVGIPTKLRRYGSLSWSHILNELTTFTARIREPPNPRKSGSFYQGKPDSDEIDEPESVLMLESYLRLMAHLCTISAKSRDWILSQSSPPILETLLALCNNTVPDRLQACAFMVIRSLVTSKSNETTTNVWMALDSWATGAYAPSSLTRPSKTTRPSSWFEEVTVNAVTAGFDQANEFTSLLKVLMATVQSSSLHDQLAFPESLGSSYRMPGVEPYIDLVIDKIYTGNTTTVDETLKTRILNDNVLHFVTICLGTFNENLLVLANKPSLGGDEAMNATQLENYMVMHPFSRTMEWLFNDRVLSALYKTSHVDIDTLVVAQHDSLVLKCLLRCIEVMNLIFDLQSTYLNVVRPLVKGQSSRRRELVSSPSSASFEDSIALNLQLIVDLGVYCGLGNQHLTAASLKLLGKIASSRRFRYHPAPGLSSNRQANPLVSVMQREDDLERIARPLSVAMEIDPRELEQGPAGSGWSIKSAVLEFLLHTLSASPDQPSIAHALLGFVCHDGYIEVEPDGPFVKGTALFHAITQFVIQYPDGDDESAQLWAISLRQMGMEVLSLLWRSPLTSAITLAELQQYAFLPSLLLRERIIDSNTLWDERAVIQADFLFSESAETFQRFLWQRNSLYEYAETEIRFIAMGATASLKSRAFSALMGLSVSAEGEQLSNPTIFDLFDFVDIKLPDLPGSPPLEFFADIDLQAFATGISSQAGVKYDANLVEGMLSLRLQGLRRSGELQDANDEQRATTEAAHISSYVQCANSLSGLHISSDSALAAWCQMVALSVEICDLESVGRTAFLLQALQMLVPKLEAYAFEDSPRATHIAKLLQYLMLQFDHGSMDMCNPSAQELGTDKAYQVFRAAIRSISAPEIALSLRETLYHLCHRFLAQTLAAPRRSATGLQIIQAVKAAGSRALEIMYDDVLGASHSGRISALLVLDALCTLGLRDHSHYAMDSLVRAHVLQILVESIESMPNELRETNAPDIPLLLTFYEAKFSLLLTINQSRTGAAHVINAGLFHAVRASGLFSVDPDIGVEIDNAEALAKYYRLLLYITRIIVSAVVTHGSQNESTLEHGRNFIRDNRALIVSAFKRQARIGGVSFDDAGVNIDELVELFVLLISATDYLKSENETALPVQRMAGFS